MAEEHRCTGMRLSRIDERLLLEVCSAGNIVSIPIADYKITSSMQEGTELVITIRADGPLIEVSATTSEMKGGERDNVSDADR